METSVYDPLLKLGYLTLFFFLVTCSSSISDTITANSSISGDRTLVSSGGRFELGFFTPSGKPSNYYIGIWYKEILPRTVVWVANRVNPISDKNSYELRVSNSNLVLTHGSKSELIWSTNLSSNASESVEAVVLESGNLVVRDGPNMNPPLWQSFDHPTDTWLPGGKLGYKKKTKQKQELTSWKNEDDPAPGLFTLGADPKETQYLLKWNNTKSYWRSGTWNPEQKIFSLVPEMRLNFLYNFSYVDNENESYFLLDVYNHSVISRSVVITNGQYQTVTWLENSQQWTLFWSKPNKPCQVYAYCGGFGSCNDNSLPYCSCLKGFEPKSSSDWKLSDYSSGCLRKTQLNCGVSSSRRASDRFLSFPDMLLPENQHSIAATKSEECELACLNNCSCNAYSFENNRCSVWYGELLNLQQLSDADPGGKMIYLRLAASEFPSKSKKKLIIGVVVGSAALTLAAIGLILALRWRQKARTTTSNKGVVEDSLTAFGYKELQTATKNFSEKLGGGGFGSVFKGALSDSSVIAVKKLESFNQGEKQFRSEVSTIGTVQHVNLVRLRGFCSEGDKKLLVYDYMPYGSLDYHLFSAKKYTTLDWRTRYQIALGTARGLAYLHEKCRDCIIHCDIKPENILLDAEFSPKVADFGLAKLVGRDFSRVLTTIRGTRGYLAPEWISGVAVTAKADVFTYGMVLFELLSGHRNIEHFEDETVNFFPTLAANKIAAEEDSMSILDPRLNGDADPTQVLRVCKLACWCIQDNENHRPMMGQVVQTLEGVLDVNMPPIPRSLEVFVENQDNVMFYTESSSSSYHSSHTKYYTTTSLIA